MTCLAHGGRPRGRLLSRLARGRLVAALALAGLLTAAWPGAFRGPLEVAGPTGALTDTLQADDDSGEPAPADKAQASAGLDFGPTAILPEQLSPPAGEFVTLGSLDLDRCRPGFRSGLERPPRLPV